MSDREKILKAAKCCLTGDPMRCPDECPYLIEGFSCGLDPFLADVIAYLNEQEHEPVEPFKTPETLWDEYNCGSCTAKVGVALRHSDEWSFRHDYCPRCGRKVKWGGDNVQHT